MYLRANEFKKSDARPRNKVEGHNFLVSFFPINWYVILLTELQFRNLKKSNLLPLVDSFLIYSEFEESSGLLLNVGGKSTAPSRADVVAKEFPPESFSGKIDNWEIVSFNSGGVECWVAPIEIEFPPSGGWATLIVNSGKCRFRFTCWTCNTWLTSVTSTVNN